MNRILSVILVTGGYILVVLASVLVVSNRSLSQTRSLGYQPKCGPVDPDTVFADMHDGDKKSITMDEKSMTIKPNDNNETWVIHASMDTIYCNATIDFNVPGKPNPPPVNLTATFWRMVHSSTSEHKMVLEFTDPSEKLAPPTMPLNVWIMIV